MSEHRKISAYGEVTIVGQPKPKQRKDASRLLRQLSYQMAPWREHWDWDKIRRLEERIDALLLTGD